MHLYIFFFFFFGSIQLPHSRYLSFGARYRSFAAAWLVPAPCPLGEAVGEEVVVDTGLGVFSEAKVTELRREGFFGFACDPKDCGRDIREAFSRLSLFSSSPFSDPESPSLFWLMSSESLSSPRSFCFASLLWGDGGSSPGLVLSCDIRSSALIKEDDRARAASASVR